MWEGARQADDRADGHTFTDLYDRYLPYEPLRTPPDGRADSWKSVHLSSMQ